MPQEYNPYPDYLPATGSLYALVKKYGTGANAPRVFNEMPQVPLPPQGEAELTQGEPREVTNLKQEFARSGTYKPNWAAMDPDTRGMVKETLDSLVPQDETSKEWLREKMAHPDAEADFSEEPFLRRKDELSTRPGKIIDYLMNRPIEKVRPLAQSIFEKQINPAVQEAMQGYGLSPETSKFIGEQASDWGKALTTTPIAALGAPLGAIARGLGLTGVGAEETLGSLLGKGITRLPLEHGGSIGEGTSYLANKIGQQEVPEFINEWVRRKGGAAPLNIAGLINKYANVSPELENELRSSQAERTMLQSEAGGIAKKIAGLGSAEDQRLARQLVEEGNANPDIVPSKSGMGLYFSNDNISQVASDVAAFNRKLGERTLPFIDEESRGRISENLGNYWGQKRYLEIEKQAINRPQLTEREMANANPGIGSQTLGFTKARKQNVPLTQLSPLLEFVKGSSNQIQAATMLPSFSRIAQMEDAFIPMSKLGARGAQTSEQATARAAAESAGWRAIPHDPNRFGALAGGYMEPHAWETVMAASTGMSRSSDYVNLFKASNAPLSLHAQFKHAVANSILMTESGVSLFKLPFLMKRAADELAERGPIYDALKRGGVIQDTGELSRYHEISQSIVKQEVDQALRPGSSSDPVKFLANLSKSLDQHVQWKGNAIERMSNLMQYDDKIFRLSKAIDVMDKGGSLQDAMLQSRKWGIDMSGFSDTIKAVSNSPLGMPFVRRSLGTVPLFSEAIATHPERFQVWNNLLGTINSAGDQLAGTSPLQRWEYRKQRAQEQSERMLPALEAIPGLKEAYRFANEISVPLHMGSSKGSPVTAELSHLILNPSGLEYGLGPVGQGARLLGEQIRDMERKQAKPQMEQAIPDVATAQNVQASLPVLPTLARLLGPALGPLPATLASPTSLGSLRALLEAKGQSPNRVTASLANTVRGNIWPGDTPGVGGVEPTARQRIAGLIAGSPEVNSTQRMDYLNAIGWKGLPRNIKSFFIQEAIRGKNTPELVRSVKSPGQTLKEWIAEENRLKAENAIKKPVVRSLDAGN